MRTRGLHFFQQSAEIIPGVKTGLGTRFVTSLERWSLDRLNPGKAGDTLTRRTKSVVRATARGDPSRSNTEERDALRSQYESAEITSPKFRVASARHGIGLMVDLRKCTEPSPKMKFAPPGWRLQ